MTEITEMGRGTSISGSKPRDIFKKDGRNKRFFVDVNDCVCVFMCVPRGWLWIAAWRVHLQEESWKAAHVCADRAGDLCSPSLITAIF